MHSFMLLVILSSVSINISAQSPSPSPPTSSASAPDEPDRQKSGCIRGTVTDGRGLGVIGAIVSVRDLVAGPESNATTDKKGSYSICVLPGEYSIAATNGMLTTQAEHIAVISGKMTKNLVLK